MHVHNLISVIIGVICHMSLVQVSKLYMWHEFVIISLVLVHFLLQVSPVCCVF